MPLIKPLKFKFLESKIILKNKFINQILNNISLIRNLPCIKYVASLFSFSFLGVCGN